MSELTLAHSDDILNIKSLSRFKYNFARLSDALNYLFKFKLLKRNGYTEDSSNLDINVISATLTHP